MGPAVLILSVMLVVIRSQSNHRLKETMDMLMKEEFNKLLPTKDHTKPIYFILYKRVNGQVVRSVASLEDDNDVFLHDGLLDRRDPVKIGIHGWQQTMNSKFVQTMVPAYIESMRNVQVVIVRWMAADQDYIPARMSIPQTAATILQYLDRISWQYGISLEQITIIGHSMGAQLAGAIGNQAYGAIGTIVALEPANPLMWQDTKDVVRKESAKKVIGVHTNAGYYGADWNVGDVDFWPNLGATPQPGCFFERGDSNSLSKGRQSNMPYLNDFDVRMKPPLRLNNNWYRNDITLWQPPPNMWFNHSFPTAINAQIPNMFGRQVNPFVNMFAQRRGLAEVQRKTMELGPEPLQNNIWELACSHEKSILLFFESVRNRKAYVARQCECRCAASCEMKRETRAYDTYFNEDTKADGQYCFYTK